jgi:hypothetical protein
MVKGIMRRISDVFMLPIDAVLDFNTMLKIENEGDQMNNLENLI